MNQLLTNSRYLSNLKLLFNNYEFNFLKNKSIFVTGASGLIGSCIVDFCLYLNNQYNFDMKIYVMGRSKDKLAHRFKPYERELTIIEHDMNNKLDYKLDKIDYIIHAANNATPKTISQDYSQTLKSTIEGTRNLLDFSINVKASKFVYISSGEVYGSLSIEDKFDETNQGNIDISNPRSAYPLGKKEAEDLVIQYHEKFNLDTLIVRPCHIFGPTALSTDDRAVMDFIFSSISNRKIVMKSLGNQVRSYVYVVDCISAILYLMNKGDKPVYNIAYKSETITIRELAETIAKLNDSELKIELPDDKTLSTFNLMSKSVLVADLLYHTGWKNLFSIKKGIEETINILNNK